MTFQGFQFCTWTSFRRQHTSYRYQKSYVLKSKSVNEINAFCHKKKHKTRWMDGFQVHPRFLITTLYRGPLRIGLVPFANWPFHGEKKMGVHFAPEKGVFCESAKKSPLFRVAKLRCGWWGNPRKSQESVSFWQARCQKYQNFQKGDFGGIHYIIGMYLTIHYFCWSFDQV